MPQGEAAQGRARRGRTQAMGFPGRGTPDFLVSWTIRNALLPRPYPSGLGYLRAYARFAVTALLLVVPTTLAMVWWLDHHPKGLISDALRRFVVPHLEQ